MSDGPGSEIEAARSRVEVNRASEYADGVDVAGTVQAHVSSQVATTKGTTSGIRATDGAGPEEVAISIELQDEDVGASGRGEVEAARARVEVDRLFEGANGVDAAGTVHSHAERSVRSEGGAQRVGPDEVAVTIELGNEDVWKKPSTGEV